MKPIDPLIYNYMLGTSFVLFSWLIFHLQHKWGGGPFIKAMGLGILLIAGSILYQRGAHHEEYYGLRLHEWEAQQYQQRSWQQEIRDLGGQSLRDAGYQPRRSKVR